MFLSICDTPGVLKIFKILRIIFFILKIVVPLVLIVLLMVDYGKATINDDKEYIIAESGRIVDVGLGVSRIAFDYQGEGGNDSS